CRWPEYPGCSNTASARSINDRVRFGLLGGGRDHRTPRHDKMNCAPKRAAVGASHDYPQSAAIRRRPWLAVRAVVGDDMCDFDHGALPVPCSVSRLSATPSGVSSRIAQERVPKHGQRAPCCRAKLAASAASLTLVSHCEPTL